MKKKSFHFLLDRDLRKVLDTLAKASGLSVSMYIQMVLRQHTRTPLLTRRKSA